MYVLYTSVHIYIAGTKNKSRCSFCNKCGNGENAWKDDESKSMSTRIFVVSNERISFIFECDTIKERKSVNFHKQNNSNIHTHTRCDWCSWYVCLTASSCSLLLKNTTNYNFSSLFILFPWNFKIYACIRIRMNLCGETRRHYICNCKSQRTTKMLRVTIDVS